MTHEDALKFAREAIEKAEKAEPWPWITNAGLLAHALIEAIEENERLRHTLRVAIGGLRNAGNMALAEMSERAMKADAGGET